MSSSTVLCGYGGWLPKHPAIYKAFIDHLVQLALRRSADSTSHEPAVTAFGEAIQGDPVMKSLFDQVFLQVDRRNKV